MTLEDEYLANDLADPLEDDTAGISIGPPSAEIAGLHLNFTIHGYLDIGKATGADLPPWE
jgi:hypothetical protein